MQNTTMNSKQIYSQGVTLQVLLSHYDTYRKKEQN